MWPSSNDFRDKISVVQFVCCLLSLPYNVWRLIIFAPFLLIIIKSPKQRLETYCFCSVSYYYYYSFFPCTMNLSTADLRNYRTEFHETWWSYRYMFLVDPNVFSFVVKGGQSHILRASKGVGITNRILWES